MRLSGPGTPGRRAFACSGKTASGAWYNERCRRREAEPSGKIRAGEKTAGDPAATGSLWERRERKEKGRESAAVLLLYPEDLAQFQDRIHAENVETLWRNQCACLVALGIAGAVELFVHGTGLLGETFFLLALAAATLALHLAIRHFVREQGTVSLYLWTAFFLTADAVFETLVEPNETGMIFMVPVRVAMLALATSALYVVLSLFRFEQEVFRSDLVRLILVNVLTASSSIHITSVYFAMLRRSDAASESAAHDSLTKILNLRGGEEKINRCLARGEGGTFILLDVDRFKHINDTYGHGIGDQALQSVAAVLGSTFRTTDVVMRMGGDEFIVYAVGLENAGAIRRKLEEIRQEVHEIVLSGSGEDEDAVCVSMGCVVNRGSFASYGDLYSAADGLLYRTKQEGKDGYCISDTGQIQTAEHA